MTQYISASTLYDFDTCPHKVWRDIWGPQEEKNPFPNEFVKLLWERGIAHEKDVMASLYDFTDLSAGSLAERFHKTKTALESGASLIYQGVLEVDNLRGIPDLLERQVDGTYLPIDIKSGMGREGVDEDNDVPGKLKPHYALQIALYADVLIRLGYATAHRGIILDKDGNRVLYDLDQPQGSRTPQTWWERYQQALLEVQGLVAGTTKNLPALKGACKLCPWGESCKKWAKETDDPTTLFYVGRSMRDTLSEDIGVDKSVELLDLDVPELMAKKKGEKTFLKGIGQPTLEKAIARSKISHVTKEPVLYHLIQFPDVPTEIYLDIEDDPTQEIVYLHGLYIRTDKNPKGEFKAFVAKSADDAGERGAWVELWQYIRSLTPGSFAVYYYSRHEKTTYRNLQKKYPDVATEDEVEQFFDPTQAIDLYTDVVLKHTDWPLSSYSIKELATYCGFHWRDKTPSGALSIKWYNDYLQNNNQNLLQRILDYNEDDCIATMVAKDKLQELNRHM